MIRELPVTPTPELPSVNRRRVLIGHLVSNGDCLYVTAIARQIKTDDPDCHLTWAISTNCRSVLNNNPHVDTVWEIPAFRMEKMDEAWYRFERDARARQARGEFDAVYMTQILPAHKERWNGTIRSTTLSGYPHPITVPLTPVLRLSESEVENVRRFAEQHGLLYRTDGDNAGPVILFECAPRSGQSFVTPDFALEVSRQLAAAVPNVKLILSSNLPIPDSAGPQILDGSTLTFRENAELTKYCTLLIGCSSGISWLCTSDWAKKLPMIQVHSSQAMYINSFLLDHRRWGLATDHIIEMYDCTGEELCDAAIAVIKEGIAGSRVRLPHRPGADPLRTYRCFQRDLLGWGWLRKAAVLFANNARLIMRSPLNILWHGPQLLRGLWRTLCNPRRSVALKGTGQSRRDMI